MGTSRIFRGAVTMFLLLLVSFPVTSAEDASTPEGTSSSEAGHSTTAPDQATTDAPAQSPSPPSSLTTSTESPQSSPPAASTAAPTAVPSPTVPASTAVTQAAAESTPAPVTQPDSTGAAGPSAATGSAASMAPTPTPGVSSSAEPPSATSTIPESTSGESGQVPDSTAAALDLTTSAEPPQSSSAGEPAGTGSGVPGASSSVGSTAAVPSTAAPTTLPTTSAPTTTTPTTTTPTTTTPTTTTPTPKYPIQKPERPVELTFKVGDTNDTMVQCTNAATCSYDDLVTDVRAAFSSVPGYLYVKEGQVAASRSNAGGTEFVVAVVFEPQVLSQVGEENRTRVLYGAFQTLDSTTGVKVDMEQVNATIVAPFVQETGDVCHIPHVCPLGYTCRHGVCFHRCEDLNCGPNGVCNTIVNTDGISSAKCVCNSDDEHTYSGSHCQNEATSKAKVAAILGGVLGTLCGLFLLIILFLCYRLRSGHAGAGRKYELGGHSNNGYADREFAMKGIDS